MANSPDFVAHALDLLSGLGPVMARRMFGGHGIYFRGLMFALLDDDELFLKADEVARPRFEAEGCRQWIYPSARGPMPGGYWRPPDEAHEEAEAMLPWARLAVGAAERKALAKAAGKARGKKVPASGARAKPTVRAKGARGQAAGGRAGGKPPAKRQSRKK
jgi:DNA transformation protein